MRQKWTAGCSLILSYVELHPFASYHKGKKEKTSRLNPLAHPLVGLTEQPSENPAEKPEQQPAATKQHDTALLRWWMEAAPNRQDDDEQPTHNDGLPRLL